MRTREQAGDISLRLHSFTLVESSQSLLTCQTSGSSLRSPKGLPGSRHLRSVHRAKGLIRLTSDFARISVSISLSLLSLKHTHTHLYSSDPLLLGSQTQKHSLFKYHKVGYFQTENPKQGLH